ncbi:MAG: hypothetical protein ABIG56_01080 [Candidatus Omnitrophota bacterium]
MKKTIVLLLSLGLVGCASAGVINNAMNYIYYKDGVDKKEASYISQKRCLEDSRCRRNCVVCSVRVAEDELTGTGVWRAVMDPKIISNIFIHKCVFTIDKETGKLFAFELIKNQRPSFQKANDVEN